ncbi:MAG TPA: hypothetical protein VN727_09145 [Candidatus Binatia bacterium]|nr:hypothetical protein [Candidatus Binatia bacterium]
MELEAYKYLPWLKDVEETFFTGFDAAAFLAPLNKALLDIQEPFASLASAFRGNLEALIAVVSMPILLASGTAQRMRFQRLSLAERISRIPIGEDRRQSLTADDQARLDREADQQANECLLHELASEYGMLQMAMQASKFLSENLQIAEVSPAARELLRQGAVLCWGER